MIIFKNLKLNLCKVIIYGNYDILSSKKFTWNFCPSEISAIILMNMEIYNLQNEFMKIVVGRILRLSPRQMFLGIQTLYNFLPLSRSRTSEYDEIPLSGLGNLSIDLQLFQIILV